MATTHPQNRDASQQRSDEHGNLLIGDVFISPSSQVRGCVLKNVTIAEDARVHHSIIESDLDTNDGRVIIGPGANLFSCEIRTKSKSLKKSFRFGPYSAAATPTRIGASVKLSHSLVVNSEIGEGTSGTHAAIRCSKIGQKNDLRSFSNIILSATGSSCNLGSEISKTILGTGFVSEHSASYLSLVAPSRFPILSPQGREEELSLPNVTNIGAGTVFANFGGEPIEAPLLTDSPGSKKGTALVFSAFTCINSRVVNQYGTASEKDRLHELYWRNDLTLLGFASFIENKATGRVPAFAYAGGSDHAGPRGQRLGWVLEHKPGIVLSLMRKMKSQLGDQPGPMKDFVEGTIRLEIEILEAEKRKTSSQYSEDQLQAGLEILKDNLDGRWKMNDSGEWAHNWSTNEDGEWC